MTSSNFGKRATLYVTSSPGLVLHPATGWSPCHSPCPRPGRVMLLQLRRYPLERAAMLATPIARTWRGLRGADTL
jgi:hypothetical protein